MTRQRATAIGFSAVVLWAFFALMIVMTAPMPALLLNTLIFTIAGALSLGWTALRGRLAVLRGVPVLVYAIGIAGLFGYHLLYFTALRLAPRPRRCWSAMSGRCSSSWARRRCRASGFFPAMSWAARWPSPVRVWW